MLYTLVIMLLIAVIGILVYLATLQGQYNVRQSQLINTEINLIFEKIKDFKSWPDWSPWLIHEPETKLQYSDDCNEEGGFYTWNGTVVGAGKLTHIKFDQGKLIQQRLEFTKPFKSICDVGFEFSEQQGQTKLTWYMDGKMPFLFRFMTEKTKDLISKDYQFGLAMLNGILNPKAEHPQLSFDGEVTLDPVHALCEGFSGGIEEMKSAMKEGFHKLAGCIEQQQAKITAKPMTAYHKVNPKTMQFVCDMAIPVEQGINQNEFQLKTLAGGLFYKVSVTGSYNFLEMAWNSAMSHVNMHKLKFDKSRPCYEVYENDPEQVIVTNEILTVLYIPIK